MALAVGDTAWAMPEAVRQKVTLFEDRPRRSLDERVIALFPPLGWRFATLLFRLSPSSPIRRRFVATLVRRGCAALNRRDLELNARVLYDRDSVLFIHGNIPIGSGPYRGGEEIIQGYREWQDAWAEQRRVPREIVDLATGFWWCWTTRARERAAASPCAGGSPM